MGTRRQDPAADQTWPSHFSVARLGSGSLYLFARKGWHSMTDSTKPIQAVVAKLEYQLVTVVLDGTGSVEDVLSEPRFTLTRIIRSVSGLALLNDSNAIFLVGDIQRRLEVWLKKLDSVLPKQRVEMSLLQATPTLVEILREMPPMIEDLKRLETFLSPLGMFH
jgi:hypothetical protein